MYVTMQRIPANADLSNALECLVSGKKSIRAMAYGMYVRTDLVDVVACPTRHAVESSIPVSTKKEGSALGFAGLACDRHTQISSWRTGKGCAYLPSPGVLQTCTYVRAVSDDGLYERDTHKLLVC